MSHEDGGRPPEGGTAGRGWRFETKAIHAGVAPKFETNATLPPVVQSASFQYETSKELADVFDSRKFGHLYTRISNPTVAAFEQRMAALEGGLGAVATSSGMAAIFSVVASLARAGDEILSSTSLFGGTLLLFNEVFANLGIRTRYFDPVKPDQLASALESSGDPPRLVFLETIGNPKMDVPDVRAMAELATDAGVPLVVDGTLTTPYLFDAKSAGASLVVHSSTKYITGNGSTVGGVVVDLGTFDWRQHRGKLVADLARKTGDGAFLYAARRHVVQNVGCCLSPFNAFLHLLGLETLALRMERHCSNAARLAGFLAESPAVERVNYPGLPDHPQHDVAAKQFGGRFGGMLTFRLASREAAFRFIDRLGLAKNLANLGDAKTLVIHPASTIFHDCSVEEMEAAGVTPEVVRVSVGIEHPDDVVADFENALEGIE
ncbi:MAG: homocysteine synthase [Promethearchaeota archaeon]